ncbi:MAG TPA: hypothetical protein VER17_09925 [Tepidisphaeraceae bacterium]|nr:hypothetical protein [Tepidisphaeraceae bacterium]
MATRFRHGESLTPRQLAAIEPLERRFQLSAAPSAAPAAEVAAAAVAPPRIMENLDRGVVAVRISSSSAFVSWRLLGLDPAGIGFNLYRTTNGGAATKLNGSVLTAGTNYTDTGASSGSTQVYYVRPVINGVEQPASGSFTLKPSTAYDPVVRVPIQAPGKDYWTKFIWVGDLDGDGEFDFIIDRLAPFNAYDNDLGMGNQYLQAYKRDGTRLWSIDMGPNSRNTYNIEPGSSTLSMGMYDGVTVADLDGNGRAEVALKIGNGVVFGDGSTFTTTNNTRQFMAVINGMTGTPMAQIEMPTDYSSAGSLGTQLGIGYLGSATPSIVGWMRNRNDDNSFNDIFAAWDFNGTAITQKWKLLMGAGTSNASGTHAFHQMRVVDVDGDGIDEVCPGNYAINANGTIRYKLTGVVHGDRFHIGKFDPNRPGLQGYGIQQNNASGLLEYYYDATTGEILWTHYGTVQDVGRGAAGDLDPNVPGYEVFSFQGIYNGPTNTRLTRDTGDKTPWPNQRIWWDGDLTSEEIDGSVINKFYPRDPADPNSVSGVGRVETLYKMGAHTLENNPMFYGDIMGDWREEAVYTNPSYSELLIFTTDRPTATRLYTLPHNPEYRNAMTVKGYNQSHHVDYYLGAGMTTPSNPNIAVAPRNPTSLPPAPTNLAAAIVSRTQVNLTWTAIGGATSYRIRRTSTNGAPHVLVATVPGTATSYSDTSLSGAGSEYYYVVTQVSSGGTEGIPSNQAGVTIGEPPYSITYQAEDQTVGGGAIIRKDDPTATPPVDGTPNSNFNGLGYADLVATTGAWLEFPNVNGGGGGAATLTFRYSQGTNTSTQRTASLIVNGVAQTITFTYTNSPNAWRFVTANATLKPGATNTVRIQVTSNVDPGNVDLMIVDVASPPAIFSGTASADRYYLRRNGALIDLWIGGAGDGAGVPTHSLVHSQAINLTFAGSGGDDTLTIDLSNGNPFPSGGISWDGGANGTAGDAVAVIGSTGADSLTFGANSLLVAGAGTLNMANAERRTLKGNGGSDAVTVNAGTVALAGLLRASTLNVGAGAALDIGNFPVVYDYSGSPSPIGSVSGGAYTGIAGMIRSGRNGGTWNGSGIITSRAQATGAKPLASIGLAEASTALGISGTQTGTWEGQTVDATTVLVNYTYAGDANLDDRIDGDDYFAIDSKIKAPGAHGWWNGDFDHNVRLDGDDYFIIDSNIGRQSTPI